VNPSGYVSEVVAFAFGLAAASFFPVIVMGIFDKRANKHGAIWGMLVGLLFTGFYIVTTADRVLDWDPWLFGIRAQAIGAVGMLLNFVVAYVVSRATAAPPTSVQEFVENIRYPRLPGASAADD
jgi:cation/acetate symporter